MEVVDNRYVLESEVGRGGMGTVYRAYDRLSDHIVALKRVNIHIAHQDDIRSDMETEDDRQRHLLALTHEFKLLSSLHHPNIISVQDYGFIGQDQPYFTMAYIANARPISAFTESTPFEKISYLIQSLEALAYLHRRATLHRDLKPDNVLVCNGEVYLLDFGLSIEGLAAQGRAGTIEYMAPETLRRSVSVEASDLYAIGVIAYQLFAGEVPFTADDIVGILSDAPDMSRVQGPDQLRQIIQRLLAKTPEARYSSAQEVITALRVVIDLPATSEDARIRDSYLQAATFVGRQRELRTLMDALEQVEAGSGVIWLVGGESGIGKSRLLDEFRAFALTHGARVMTGQATEGRGLPFQLWRNIVHRLVLHVDPSDQEASILKALVPDMERILGRAVADAGELTTESSQQRLASTIVSLLKRLQQPTVLLLEDLQWAEESLEPIRLLRREISTLPLLIIGSYRSDERPQLPSTLDVERVLPLSRLSPDEIGQFAVSVIGEAAHEEKLLRLLEQETEGNVLFLLEVIRALADEVGQLERIGRTPLPTSVFTDGIGQILQRRLQRAPDWAQPLINAAAVAGRELDTRIITYLTPLYLPNKTLDQWLYVCTDAAILEPYEGHWRFVHDKIRETLLHNLSDHERAQISRDLALAIEENYPDDAAYIELLIEHWHDANDLDREIAYITESRRWKVAAVSDPQLIRFAQRALDRLPEVDTDTVQHQRMRLKSVMAGGMMETGQNDQARDLLLRALQIAEQLGDIDEQLYCLHNIGVTAWRQGYYESSLLYSQRCLQLAEEQQNVQFQSGSHYSIGIVYHLQGNYEKAEQYHHKALSLRDTTGDQVGRGHILNALGLSIFANGDYEGARPYFYESLQIHESINRPIGQFAPRTNLGLIALLTGDFDTARDHFIKVLDIGREAGRVMPEASSLGNLGLLAEELGDIDEAHRLYTESLDILQACGYRRAEVNRLIQLVRIAFKRGEEAIGWQMLRQALCISRELDVIPATLNVIGGAAYIAWLKNQDALAARWLAMMFMHPVLEPEHCIDAHRIKPLLEELTGETLENFLPQELSLEQTLAVGLDEVEMYIAAHGSGHDSGLPCTSG